MHDQAAALRLRVRHTRPSQQVRTIAVTSGKGGVGKTNFTLNFAIQLAKAGHRVAVLDADLGFANIGVLMGLSSRYTMLDLLTPGMALTDVMETGPQGIRVIPGLNDVEQLYDLSSDQLASLATQLKELQKIADFIIVDTAAGLTKDNLSFISAADEVILVTTPEPTAITDGYAVMKVLFQQHGFLKIWTVINRTASHTEAQRTGQNMSTAVKRFLQREVQMLGYLPDHTDVVRAVKQQQPFSECFPNSAVTRRLQMLTRRYLSELTKTPQERERSSLVRLLQKMLWRNR